MTTKKLALITGGIALMISIVAIGLWFLQHAPVSAPLSNSQSNDGVYRSNAFHISFPIPAGWEVSTAPVDTPLGVKAEILLMKIGSPCRIAMVKTPTGFTAKQVSFADRVFSQYWQFDGNWLIPNDDPATTTVTFTNFTRQYLKGEFRLSGSARRDPIVLWDIDHTPVPDECNATMNAVLQNIEPYYVETTLSPASDGMLTVQKEWDDLTGKKTVVYLLFTPSGTNDTYLLRTLPFPAGWWGVSVYVHGDKLYTVVTTPDSYQPQSAEIDVIDPATGSITAVPGTHFDGVAISDMYMREGYIYFLKNDPSLPPCTDGPDDCYADMYRIPLAGGTASLVAKHVQGGAIAGYDPVGKAFYTEKGWGDAGSASVHIDRIDSSGTVADLGRQSEFDGQQTADSAQIALPTFEQFPTGTALRISGGHLIPVTALSSLPTQFYLVP